MPNFQDVLRDVHNPVTHTLQTDSGGATIFAVVNTTASSGLATVNINGSATIFAVVNTAAAGVGNSIVTINPRTDYFGLVSVSGNVAVSSLPATPAGANFIGLVSVSGFANPLPVTFSGNVTLSDAKTYIGLTTATIGSMPSVLASGQYFPTPQSVASGALAPLAVDAKGELLLGNPNTYIGLASVNVGGIAAGANYIGLMSVNIGGILPALVASTVNIGSVSVLGGTIGLGTGALNIGSVSVLGGTILANLNTGTLNIGSVSILGGKIVNDTSTLNIGSVSILGGIINSNLQTGTLNIGSVSVLGGGIGLNAGVNGIGFVTVNGGFIKNGGTNKTLVSVPIGFSVASTVTIAVPTNNNTMYITNLLINSDATVRITLLSGVTYMNGNASNGITLNPGGGWIETGAPDSPTYIGNPSGAIVINKFDMTATSAKIAGKVVYFQE